MFFRRKVLIPMKVFRNPVADFDTPDPFMTYDKVTGYYYALFTRHEYLEIFRSLGASAVSLSCDTAQFCLRWRYLAGISWRIR